jgi:hypothetical protein
MHSIKPISLPIRGGHVHRSGWPYVTNLLECISDARCGIPFDDFIEKTFLYGRVGLGTFLYDEPWIGVAHYPPEVPDWYVTERLESVSKSGSFISSLPNLRLCISFSPEQEKWIDENWKINTALLRHPTEVPDVKWTPAQFEANPTQKIVQIGWYLRNTAAIFQLGECAGLTKCWLRSSRSIAALNHLLCSRHFARDRAVREDVAILDYMPNHEYDKLLSENIVFVELISSVANNTVIECIARNTPVLVNRMPGPEFYLGIDYPLFYDHIDDVPALCSPSKIIDAYAYLRNMDKEWIHGRYFLKSLCSTIDQAFP